VEPITPEQGCRAVSDKQTPLIVDALTLAAAEATGSALYAAKNEPGLFPATVVGKAAAQKALENKWLKIISTETKGKVSREVCTVTESGLHYLLDQVSPKQVLEDFVRVLEQREGQVGELLELARRMTDQLGGLKAALTMILPQVQAARVPTIKPAPVQMATAVIARQSGSTAVMEAPESEELGEVIVARLQDWSSSAVAGQDCPLPELYRSLSMRSNPPTLGEFHDALRTLHHQYRVYLHPWTGPLYAMPEPSYALLSGHNIAYYASAR
jgi:hypothetical protein